VSNAFDGSVVSTLKTKNCVLCNKLFIYCGKNQKFCNEDCREKYWKEYRASQAKEPVKLICISCSSTFIPYRNSQKYCDKKCRPIRNKKPAAAKKVCIFCSNLFVPYHPNRQKYCSQKCMISATIRPFKKVSCNQCGVVFEPGGASAKFCSIECRDISYLPRKQEHKTNHKLKKYGLTAEDYEHLIVQHNNCCAICHQPEKKIVNGKLRRLAIDHCHITGVVRGLLCFQCNVGLGNFNDNWVLLDNASEYLMRRDLKAGINQRWGSRNVNA
jgi:hypothetical protein